LGLSGISWARIVAGTVWRIWGITGILHHVGSGIIFLFCI
jgi:hypothetical protein